MNARARASIQFLLGVGCVIAAAAGAFCHLNGFYFSVLFAGGCGLMGQRSIWEKIAAIARGNNDHADNRSPLDGEARRKLLAAPKQQD